MEVMDPSPPVEFHFDSTSTSPFISAPGSPQPFGIPFYSAPTSPTRLSAFYTDQFDDFSAASCDSPTVISDRKQDHDDVDFEFNFGGHIDKTSPLSSLSVSAAELFHAGQIKPFQPSSKLQFVEQVMGGDSPTQNSPEFFPTSKNNFAETETQAETETEHPYQKESTVIVRGERNYKGSRSLPTFRISDMLLENGNEKTLDSSSTTGKWGWRVRGWRLKDILLFRSASDGRVMEKHPLKKYELLNKVSEEVDVVKVSSFRSSESVQSSSSSSSSKGDSRKGGPPAMSAHEIHYTANRAASEEKKRRTFLPYKQTLLGGCLGFNPAVHDRNTGTLGLSTRGR